MTLSTILFDLDGTLVDTAPDLAYALNALLLENGVEENMGKENIPTTPCVIISNHQSTWETIGLQQVFPHQTWVLKRELLLIPVFGWALAMLKPCFSLK
jgi:phosphoglycolate phosphatase-like HAD superfamily hydrolase